jgi:hypothetical protein
LDEHNLAHGAAGLEEFVRLLDLVDVQPLYGQIHVHALKSGQSPLA